MTTQFDADFNHPLVLETILSTRWAIKPETFSLMMGIVNGEGDPKQAALIRGGRLSNEPRNVEVLGQGVAVIPIVGPIIPRATMFSQVSGVASAQGLQKDFAAAIDDPMIKAIVLDIDSPGGAVTGIAELSQMIFEARGKKPITSYVRGIGASAAYWVLSAADKIVLSETAEVGSIGVIMAYTDKSQQEKEKGVQRIEIISSLSPKKRLDPLTPDGLQAYQGVVDDLAAVMVENIARNRGVSNSDVVSGFGEGFVFVGAKAINQKMADAVGTFDSVLLSSVKPKPTFNKGVMFMSEVKTYTQAEVDVLVGQATAAGKSAGVLQEKERLQKIEALKAPGYEEIVAKLKFTEGATADTIAVAILEAQAARQTQQVTAHKQDLVLVNQVSQAVGAQPPQAPESKTSTLAAQIAAGANARRNAGKSQTKVSA